MIMSTYHDDDRDRLDELTAIWPYDGPHSAKTVTDAARGISELVRYINNATSTIGRYRYMSQTASVAGSLAAAAYGLDQLLHQMNVAIGKHIDAGDLYDDHCPQDPFAGAARADVARQQTEEARAAATILAQRLSELHNTMNAIGHW